MLEKQALVLFLENELDESIEMPGKDIDQLANREERNTLVAQLQTEVQHLREQLQVTIEEYDSSNEEMKAANEELQSINEEYRSATEELETSKEELQSVNEELQTVNNDMKSKLEEISSAHQELENLMGATEIGTLFLDRELRIQRFTAGVNEVLNVMPGDRNRPIGHLTHKLRYEKFTADAEQVLRQLISLEREVETEEEEWYLLRFRPYRTKQNRVEGVVITFINITELKASEAELVRAKETLEERVFERTHELDEANQKIRQVRDLFFKLFYSNPIPTSLTQMEDGKFINVNDAYLKFAGLERDQVIGHTSLELGLPIAKEMRSRVIDRLQKNNMLRNIELKFRHSSGEVATVLGSIQLITIDQTQALLMSFIDISERVKAEQQIRSLAYDLTIAEQEERRRLSQLLHDDLQQRIFAVKMQLATFYDAGQSGDVHTAQIDFAQIQEWLDEAIAMTRNLSIDLSPAILRGDGLTDALIWLSSQMETLYGLKVNLNSNGIAAKYDDAMRILLFQVVREVLFNIVKHANTLEANIMMDRVDHHTRITISDGGMGFDPQTTLNSSKTAGGLLNFQHRLNLMGCNLQVKSQPNVKGTQVIIDIPLDK